jgi:hypothetical protein
LRDIWRSDPALVSDQDPDRAIVAQAEKTSGCAGQLDYLPHVCGSSRVAVLYGSDFKKLIGSSEDPAFMPKTVAVPLRQKPVGVSF